MNEIVVCRIYSSVKKNKKIKIISTFVECIVALSDDIVYLAITVEMKYIYIQLG